MNGFITSSDSPFEPDAKEAYAIFQHRTGAQAAYEQLSQQEMQAWRETVEHIEYFATCEPLPQPARCECGEELVCPACDQAPRPLPREKTTTKAKARIIELEDEVQRLKAQIAHFDEAFQEQPSHPAPVASRKRRARSKA